MNTTNIRKRFAALLPARDARQPKTSLASLGSISALTTVSAFSNNTGPTGASGLSNVLQSTLKEASAAVTQSNKQLSDLQALQQQLLASTNQNIQALNANTAAKGNTGSSAMSTFGSLASSILGQGSILSPIITGIMRLFGGQSSAQPAFVRFTMPPSIQMQTEINAGAAAGTQPGPATANGGPRQVSAAPQIQIQVSAIDARSFLDHSDAIAEAVRQALLSSHSLGDVISEL